MKILIELKPEPWMESFDDVKQHLESLFDEHEISVYQISEIENMSKERIVQFLAAIKENQ